MITEPSTNVKVAGSVTFLLQVRARVCVRERERERELSTNFLNYLLHPFLLLVIQKSDSQTLVAAASQQLCVQQSFPPI